jgi:hypothetical protein
MEKSEIRNPKCEGLGPAVAGTMGPRNCGIELFRDSRFSVWFRNSEFGFRI